MRISKRNIVRACSELITAGEFQVKNFRYHWLKDFGDFELTLESQDLIVRVLTDRLYLGVLVGSPVDEHGYSFFRILQYLGETIGDVRPRDVDELSNACHEVIPFLPQLRHLFSPDTYAENEPKLRAFCRQKFAEESGKDPNARSSGGSSGDTDRENTPQDRATDDDSASDAPTRKKDD
jgi:hypothetical protein